MIIEDCAIIAKKETVPPSRGRREDFLLKSPNSEYIFTGCHGSVDGGIYLHGNTSSSPCSQLKNDINEFFENSVSFIGKKLVYIIPCHPLIVNQMFKVDLEQENIVVMGEWPETTRWTICKNKKINLDAEVGDLVDIIFDEETKFYDYMNNSGLE